MPDYIVSDADSPTWWSKGPTAPTARCVQEWAETALDSAKFPNGITLVVGESADSHTITGRMRANAPLAVFALALAPQPTFIVKRVA